MSVHLSGVLISFNMQITKLIFSEAVSDFFDVYLIFLVFIVTYVS